ncbi:patatin-like phospholipase family protein [Granulicella sp. L60]|uniref:patatin-like phospholipase family protein n=1 Tax=Granulicella sp. L60 TaxID=1641866 RepID=UPI00131ABBAC|nr:patatin-like phospholipase family protein [Granulicella sp. L60]
MPATAPAAPPPGPTNRPRIGLALGGGGALAMTEIGVLEWFEDHHIPVDMIAGTSMGGLVGALYATGKSIDELKSATTDEVFNNVFSFRTAYKSRSFRRREDARELPNGLTIGLKHGVSLRNSVLIDQGLNAFLDREFLRYDDRTDFNKLPIPFRCLSTDLNEARTVTFARGSIPDAVRASVSLPGIFQPFELSGHEFVDGAVLENLPTQTVHAMQADVVLAVSVPLKPVGKGDLDSILGVLQRSFAVAIEGNERASRKLANVVIEPDISGFNDTDYLKSKELAARGYEAAEKQKEALLKYALSETQWSDYLVQRAGRRPGPPGNLLRVRVKAPNTSVTRAVEREFMPLVNHPVDTKAIESLLDDIRSDGRYEADYTIGYERPDASSSISERPIVLVTVTDKKTGPPFLITGANVEAQAGGTSRATAEGIFLYQDLGGYGSELRANIKVGFLTQLDGEYYRKLFDTKGPAGAVFLAPHGGILRQPFYIYQDQHRLSERLLQSAGGGVDIGWSNQRSQELRAGWESDNIRWQTQVGSDNEADVFGQMQRGHIRYTFDNQDRALIPHYGIRWTTDAGYLYSAVASPNAPQITTRVSFSHEIGKEVFVMVAEGGTMFNRDVAQPFRFTLGGPLRLSASAFDEYRGTDYFLLSPALLRRIAQLPAPLGQSIYIGAAYEAGQIRAPNALTITRQDVVFGLVAETPLGVITLTPAIGDDGHRKFIFTLGKLF